MRRQITARVPDDTYALLRALTALRQVSQAELLTEALEQVAAGLTSDERKALRVLQQRALAALDE
jgi:hypothetical protein